VLKLIEDRRLFVAASLADLRWLVGGTASDVTTSGPCLVDLDVACRVDCRALPLFRADDEGTVGFAADTDADRFIEPRTTGGSVMLAGWQLGPRCVRIRRRCRWLGSGPPDNERRRFPFRGNN
jgi:hypothetical protein